MAPTADIETFYACSDATELARLVRAGEVTAAELAEAAIAHIERLNPRLDAVIHRLDDLGPSIAAATDSATANGALAGVSLLLEELASSWAGAPLTYVSRYLRDVVASEDGEAVRRAGGAVVRELDGFDATVTPTLTQPPRPVGYHDMATGDLDVYDALWTDTACAFPFDDSGRPAISLLLAQGRHGLPIGVQAVGRHGREDTLLRLGAALEAASPWADRRPEMAA